MAMTPVYHYIGHLRCHYVDVCVCGPNSELTYRFVILAENVMPVGISYLITFCHQ